MTPTGTHFAVPSRTPKPLSRPLRAAVTLVAGGLITLALVRFGVLGFAIACLLFGAVSIAWDALTGRASQRHWKLVVEQDRIREARRTGQPLRRTTTSNKPILG